MKVKYKSFWVYDTDGISIFFPALSGCCTCGNSDADSKLMAQDALKCWIDCRINDFREALPEDLTTLELHKWIKNYQLSFGKKKWKVKTVSVEV